MSLVLEMAGVGPNYGAFCLECQQPWPCEDAAPDPGRCPLCGKSTPVISKTAGHGIRCSVCIREERTQ
jgi:hypothetical protein